MKKTSIFLIVFFSTLFLVEGYYFVRFYPSLKKELPKQLKKQKEKELGKFDAMDRVAEEADSLRSVALVIVDIDADVYHYNTRCMRITDSYSVMTEQDAEDSGFDLCEDCKEEDIPIFTTRYFKERDKQ